MKYDLENHARGKMPEHMDWEDYVEGPAFVDNPRAVLIHRVRACYDHTRHGEVSHYTVQLECGAFFGSQGSVELVDTFPRDRILCAHCEAKAVAHGKPPATKLLGRKHVCIGGVRAYRTCGCSNDNN